jgi:hypothetical protein
MERSRAADWTDEGGTSEEGKSPRQRGRAADWTCRGNGEVGGEGARNERVSDEGRRRVQRPRRRKEIPPSPLDIHTVSD